MATPLRPYAVIFARPLMVSPTLFLANSKSSRSLCPATSPGRVRPLNSVPPPCRVCPVSGLHPASGALTARGSIRARRVGRDVRSTQASLEQTEVRLIDVAITVPIESDADVDRYDVL